VDRQEESDGEILMGQMGVDEDDDSSKRTNDTNQIYYR
jgi:hypothetical protein